jgi:hypothetical protein
MRTSVNPSLLPEISDNGGFPEPPAGEPVRVVAARHSECGEATRVRLPSSVPARAVRRMCCARCAQPFSADRVEEVAVEDAGSGRTKAPRAKAAPVGPQRSRPSLARVKLHDFDPDSRFWTLLSLPLAAVAVIVALVLLQGGDDSDPFAETEPPPTTPATAEAGVPVAPKATAPATSEADAAAGTEPAGTGKDDDGTRFASGSTYSLALPAGWEEVEASGGATFSAAAADGEAEVSLWVTENPNLDYPEFVNQSLRQLQSLTGSRPEIVERVPGPDADSTVVRLAADSPEGEPTYEVTLRVNGPYRYYLATTVQPDAPEGIVADTELIAGSFTPEAKG